MNCCFKRMVRSTFILIMFVVLFLISSFKYVYAANDSQSVKRIISVVFDDSYSMTSNEKYPDKQDDMYAKYALENVIGFMNDNDELNVVRMSEKTRPQKYDVNGKDNKMKGIKTVETWISNGRETPFQAVETAIEYLKDSKELNGKNDGIEYWLLILTDGDFEGRPGNVEEYFNNLRVDMSDVKYESVWVFIGEGLNKSFSGALQNVQGTTVLLSDNNEKICDAVYEACSVIYGRPTIKQSNFVETNGNKTITINSKFPVSKLMVYEQDQDASLDSIVVSGGKTYNKFESIEVTKSKAPAIKSKITENDISDIIPAGDITLNFANPVNTSENKFMIMLDYALELQLGVVDSSGKFETVPTSSYKNGDNVSFAAKVINLYDGKEVDLGAFKQGLTSSYTYDGKSNNMSLDGSDNIFKFVNPVKVGSNVFNSLVSLNGQFRLKSNIVDIYVPSGPVPITASISGEDITVSKKLGDYEKVGTKEIKFTGFDSEEKLKIEFENVPKGIQIRANNNTVKRNNIEIRVRGKQPLNIDVYRNKDFASEETNQIDMRLNFVNQNMNDLLQTHNLSFDITPSTRVLRLDASIVKGVDMDSLNSDNAFNKNILQIIPTVDGKNMDMEELKKAKVTFKTTPSKIKSKLNYKFEEIDGQNGIYVYLKPAFNWFSRGEDFTFDVNVKTAFGEEISTTNHSISIKNNIIGALIKTFILLFIIWFIVGLIKKPRFDRQSYKIIVTEDGYEKANEIIRPSSGLGNLSPYKPQKGVAYDLDVEAGQNKNYIVIKKSAITEGMYSDGVEIDRTRDFKLHEQSPLVVKTGNSKKTYVYTSDVTTDNINDFVGGRSGGSRRPANTGTSGAVGSSRSARGRRASSSGASSGSSSAAPSSGGTSPSEGGGGSRRRGR